MTDAEKAILQSFQTLAKNKREWCKSRSCNGCVFDRYVDGVYDSDEDSLTICNSIDYVSDEMDNVLD